MKEDKDILSKIGRDDGIRVPEGYFADFARRMADELPYRPELAEMGAGVPPRTMWERVRPYVYMAAMFAGVWCMLKMFTGISGTGTLAPMESNPIMAEALGNDYFMNNYLLDEVSDRDIMDEMMQDGITSDSISFDSLLAE